MSFIYSLMRIEDYDEMYALWQSIPGIGLNKADEQENIRAYLFHNREQSFLCKLNGKIIGTIMCGNDSRRAFIYHLAVSPEYRRHGIATKLVRLAINKQKQLNIDKCALFILNENILGKKFWTDMGFSIVHEAGVMVKSISPYGKK